MCIKTNKSNFTNINQKKKYKHMLKWFEMKQKMINIFLNIKIYFDAWDEKHKKTEQAMKYVSKIV